MRCPLLATLVVAFSMPVFGTDELDTQFGESIRPFLKTYCVDCHNADNSEGDLDLDSDRELGSVVKNFRRWMVVMDRLQSGDMPPEEADAHPDPLLRKQVVDWIREVRQIEAQRQAGDPGMVLARRLSNAEYNYTIRDLTGFDLQPTQTFPVDPANQEGFDNSGESLMMSPSLVKKYMEAARHVADHLVLTPTGLDFAPHPVITETDRDKYCVNRIVDFYQRQRTDYAEYFFALWQYQLRGGQNQTRDADLQAWAEQQGLSPRYMTMLWDMLTSGEGDSMDVGPLAALRIMWRNMPADLENEVAAKQQIDRIKSFVVTLRKQLVPQVDNLTTPEVHQGSQPLVLWKNRQFVANRRRYAGGALEVADFPLPDGSLEMAAMEVPSGDDARAKYEDTFAEFCSLFPDAFVVSERARIYLNPEEEKGRTGRLLSAGFHSQMGYFRDDAPLYDLLLSDDQRAQLDRLWLELDFVTAAPMRQYAGFIWFDRTDSRFMRDSQFDRFRAEDKDCISAEKVRALADAYVTKAEKVGGNPQAIEAIQFYFDDMSKTFRRLERLTLESESVQLEALIDFAGRAYRRPLSEDDRRGIRSHYQMLRRQDGLNHEDAIRDSLVTVLMSPHFCYRLDLPGRPADGLEDAKILPLDDIALASRLSYFLWASMPDRELLDLAQSGRLHDPEVLRRQVRRMLADPRVEGLIREFAGSWLGFRRFQQHNGVDRNRFPQFTDELRQSMFEEPIRLFEQIIKTDGSILDLLYADYMYVDRHLARHYGIPEAQVTETENQWVRVDGAGRHGRGGIMPMAVFLTSNSPGLRTSPVKRGNWLVQQVFGEHIPAPPAAVPDLPSDESQLGNLTLREALERHRAEPSCAACHDRIDSFGLVFEQYGPVGERRETDLGGRTVDSHVVFPDGSEGDGIAGLRDYIRRERQTGFVENFCRKLLAYGLGRSLQLSDEVAVEQMQNRMPSAEYRFGTLVESIVTSKAFLNKRMSPP